MQGVEAVRSMSLKAGDSVWVATAILQRQHPEESSFPVSEIVAKVKELGLTDREEISVYVHANQHCVANRPPNPAKLKMLIETADGERRLFCPGDRYDRQRDGRSTPKPSDLPVEYLPLLEWYRVWCDERRAGDCPVDPLLALRGSGRELWASEHADVYLENLRQEHA